MIASIRVSIDAFVADLFFLVRNSQNVWWNCNLQEDESKTMLAHTHF